MTRLDFPTEPEALTPELLTGLLAIRYPGVLVRERRLIERSSRGAGKASTADRMSIELEYARGRDEGLPSRMVLKTVLLDKRFRFGPTAVAMTGGLVRGLGRLPFGRRVRPWVFSAVRSYQRRYPHAPDAMYRNEVRFYEDIRPELDIEAPQAFASFYDERARTFAILMEDLSLRSACFPNATMSIAVERMQGLLTTLATLHARYWESPKLRGELSWLATPRAGGMYPVFRALGLDLVRNQVETNPFKAELIAPLGRSIDELWSALWRLQEILDSAPVTLLHGDPHIGNTYLLDDGSGGLLDWQLMVKGRWAHDVTYVMITGLSTEDRRVHEWELLAFYLNELRRSGVRFAPTTNEAWDLYRKSVAWGLLIGWLITPPENYGESITAANIRRLVAAASDLETFELL